MKRKLLITLLAVVSCLACALGLVACDDTNINDGGDNKPSHTHTYSTTWTGDETYHWHICLKDNCDEVSDKAEHVWDSGEVTKEPACTAAGTIVYTCTVCDKTKTEEVAATGHFFSEEWTKDETHHWHNCTVTGCEGKDEYAEHDFTNGDCVCGQPKPHTHIWSQSWERNDTHHWHNCTAENCTVTDNSQKDGYAEHDFSNGNCVCGQPKPTDGLEYMSNGDGKSYSVTGIGTCTDTVIVIPSVYNNLPVTKIAEYAFSNDKIYSVTIPDSVTIIDRSAFTACRNLTSVTIGNGVTTIGDNAFNFCRNLTSVTIGNGVTTIGSEAFINCSSLTTITIPDSVTTIGDDAFILCSSLKYNEYENAYYLGSASNPYLVLIKAKDTSITNYTINNNTKIIYNGAFSSCDNLTSITIPDSVTSIGSDAFSICNNLTSVTIGNGVTTIGDNAFNFCINLTSVTIGNGVTTIGSKAFYSCNNLTSVTIPDSVTTIGDDAFYNCSSLKYNEYENAYYLGNASNPYLVLIKAKNVSVTNCTINSNTKLIYYIAFYNCSKLTSVTIGNGVTTIGDKAFEKCSSLTTITIPDSVTTIGSNAFYSCNNLTSVTIGNGVTSIGESAFEKCSSLTTITIPDSVTTIGSYAFSRCDNLTSVTIGNGVTTIGSKAFYGCDNLTSVTIGNGVTTIGDYAFENCSSLTTITIPDSVTTIGSGAFYGCTGIIQTENGVQYVDKWVIDCDTSIKSATLRVDTKGIANYSFGGCDSLISITIPDSVTSIGSKAFNGCGRLRNITLKGTKEQWNDIKKGSNWDSSTGNYTIYCTDGEITKN